MERRSGNPRRRPYDPVPNDRRSGHERRDPLRRIPALRTARRATVYTLIFLGAFVIFAGLSYFVPAILTESEPAMSETLESRAKALSDSLAEAVSIVDQLEQEIEIRQSIAKELQGEIETNKQLAQLNAEEAKAVATLVERKLSRSFWRDTAIGLMFFLLGAIVTVFTGRIYHYRREH